MAHCTASVEVMVSPAVTLAAAQYNCRYIAAVLQRVTQRMHHSYVEPKLSYTVKCGILNMRGVTLAHCKMMHVRQLTGDMVSGNEVTQTVTL